ncbi:MAG: hypothetical protein JOZ19_11495 [Rubrobacter sp.]|nr:hypothetical protein [Rubrobacter sp.]
MTAENGYAGSFDVHGYGLWPRDIEAGAAADAELAPETAWLPMRRSIVTTEAVRRAAAEGPVASVTVVPVLPGGKAKRDDHAADVLTIDEDIEFHGVDHSGASYEARIFLNIPEADETTERTAERGYAGSFHLRARGMLR